MNATVTVIRPRSAIVNEGFTTVSTSPTRQPPAAVSRAGRPSPFPPRPAAASGAHVTATSPARPRAAANSEEPITLTPTSALPRTATVSDLRVAVAIRPTGPRTGALSDPPVALPPSRRRLKHRRLLWISPLLLSPFMYLSVQALARTEDALAIQVQRNRVVTYTLEPRGRLTFPIEPNTDVMRFVARAFSRTGLPPAPHAARIVFEVRGATRTRSERVEVPLSGLIQHAVAEDAELSVGDASPINIDVHDTGAGELTLTLEDVGDADGLLVRAYGREADGGAVWRKLAPLGDDMRGVTPRTLALARSQAISNQPARGALGTFAVSGDERVTGSARGPNTIVARAANSSDAVVTMLLRSALHGEHTIAGVGQVVADLSPNEHAEFEVASEGGEAIAIDAADGGNVSLGRSLRYFRSAPDRPVQIVIGSESLVLQVHARRPVARSSDAPVDIALVSTFTKPSRRSSSTLLSATSTRSRFDRYEDADGELAPTDAAVFRLLVPARTRLALKPRDGELDLSLSELDPHAPAQQQDELADVSARKIGFETRWPSNAADFDAHTGLMHVSPKFALNFEPPPEPTLAMAYVTRPRNALAIRREGKWFVRADSPIALRVTGKQPLVLPMRIFAERASDAPVRIEIDGGRPRRRTLGSVQRITTNRSVTLDGMVKTYVILGDDLSAGRHTIAFTTDAKSVVWVQLPWLEPNAPRWISGSFGQ